MAGRKRWQYALVWTPGDEFSTVALVCVGDDGRRHVWDSFEQSSFPEMPTHRQVLDELYQAAVTAMERTTHLI